MNHCAKHINDLENHPSRINKEDIIKAIAEDGNEAYFINGIYTS